MEWQPRRRGWVKGGEIITMLGDGHFRCALCRGKGVLPPKGAQCPVCRAQGTVKVSPPAAICAYCQGRGEVPSRSRLTCTVCDGKGVVSMREPIEVCQNCRGTGAAPGSKLPCLACAGKGAVTAGPSEEMTEEKAATDSRAERLTIQREAQSSPILPQEVALLSFADKGDEGAETDQSRQHQHRRETRTVNAGAVSSLARRLIAAERARFLSKKAIRIWN